MKTKIYLIVLLFLPVISFGQEKRKVLSEVKVTPPSFTGIKNVVDVINNDQQESIDAYLADNFQYPDVAAECYKQGTGVVQFMVNSNGEVNDFHVVNSVCPEIDQEFIRVLKTTNGMWKPGYKNNVATEMENEVSMIFIASQTNMINPVEYFTSNAKRSYTKANDLFITKGNPKKALKYYDNSIKFLPYDTSSLLLRGLCKYELGDEQGALKDWNRINELGKFNVNVDELYSNLSDMKGYAEMNNILKK